MPNRRQFMVMSGAAATAAGAGLFGDVSTALAMPKAERDRLTPAEILALMKTGNERFMAGVRRNRDFLQEQRDRATGQFPAAAILSCIDSRAPAEIIMDLGIGDVFNARIAGNVANPDLLGSLEFACQVAGAKVVLVLGHTACGAIKGAIDAVQLGNLSGLLDKIKPAVAATTFAGERTSKNDAFVDAVAKKNVELTIEMIRAQSPILRGLEEQRQLLLVGAMYDLATARVQFL